MANEIKIMLGAIGRRHSRGRRIAGYSTVTDFARFRGWSTSVPLETAA